MLDLKGVIPALITPAKEDISFDKSPMPKLIEFLISKKVNGFFVGGSTGEGFFLTQDERKKLAESAVDNTAGRVPVIIHVGSMNPREAQQLSAHARKIGANAISAVIPFYYSYKMSEISEYYKMLSESSGLPLIVYVLAQSSKLPCSPEAFIDAMDSIDNVYGIKYTGEDIYMLQNLVRISNGKYRFFGGNDRLPLAMLTAGACGLIGSNFNAVPEIWQNIYEPFTAGNMEKAIKAQEELASYMQSCGNISPIARVKYMLKLRGIDVGEARFPQAGLLPKEKKTLSEFIRKQVTSIG